MLLWKSEVPQDSNVQSINARPLSYCPNLYHEMAEVRVTHLQDTLEEFSVKQKSTVIAHQLPEAENKGFKQRVTFFSIRIEHALIFPGEHAQPTYLKYYKIHMSEVQLSTKRILTRKWPCLRPTLPKQTPKLSKWLVHLCSMLNK